MRNVVGPTMGAFPQVNPEFVVKANPQIIFLGERAAIDLQNRPGWHRIEALQNQRVCSFTPAQSDIVVRSGPRIAEIRLGRRPVPQDGLPLLGGLPGFGGATLAVTHSGVTLAPLIGRLLAREILFGEESALLAPFRPLRLMG
ncbi:MAG: ABC transporter substrate-binding protein [Rhodobacteraceae bacterium]|nr:ABC transporter substrate-binding protein [Paracoccaceae bacterium]